jgi:hypothetical protein
MSFSRVRVATISWLLTIARYQRCSRPGRRSLPASRAVRCGAFPVARERRPGSSVVNAASFTAFVLSVENSNPIEEAGSRRVRPRVECAVMWEKGDLRRMPCRRLAAPELWRFQRCRDCSTTSARTDSSITSRRVYPRLLRPCTRQPAVI